MRPIAQPHEATPFVPSFALVAKCPAISPIRPPTVKEPQLVPVLECYPTHHAAHVQYPITEFILLFHHSFFLSLMRDCSPSPCLTWCIQPITIMPRCPALSYPTQTARIQLSSIRPMVSQPVSSLSYECSQLIFPSDVICILHTRC